MKTQKIYSAALYLRLSKDDEGAIESASITTQRKMLLAYAKEHSFTVYDEYIDDGFSGTNFERPSFKRMIQDIEDKKINLVITKDLSRLGREYIATGQYTEIYFPTKGVRYIAVNDGYDSDSSYTADMAPLKNVFNEMYARDTSRKIRSAQAVKMEEGSFIGPFAPYGYAKDPENKNHLVVDYVVAPIVQEIFQMAESGCRPGEIARYLNENHIMTPVMYRCSTRAYLDIDHYSKRKEWLSATICKMLKNVVYLGYTAQGKTSKVSFKSKVTIVKSEDEWIVVKSTHEPLVSEETFERVRKRVVSRKNSPKTDFHNIFSGIAKCMDCGRNMSTTGTRRKGSVYNLVCGGYKLYGKRECSNHFIDYSSLYDVILKDLQSQVCLSEQDKIEISQSLENQQERGGVDESIKIVNSYEKRITELDHIIQKLYEDNVCGKISDERFGKLMQTYEVEQKQLVKNKKAIEKSAEVQMTEKEAYRNFFHLISDISDMQELTADLLHKLIDHIEIGQGFYANGKRSGSKHQIIRIYYKFIGTVDKQVIA